MILFPNCKINIGLNITGRREDGFHEIETLMFPVNGLTDIMEITPSDESGLKFTVSGMEMDCAPGKNICVRAYDLMAERYPAVKDTKMHLHKITPFGAGLGGGSADAAFAIKGIDKAFGLGLADGEMEELCALIGSDTAFFIKNIPQTAFGRGEILTSHPMPQLSGLRLVIAKPEVSISTAEAYAGVTVQKPLISLEQCLTLPVTEWKGRISNGFEKSVFGKYPGIGRIKDALYDAGALYASMSGSGSAVYGFFADTGNPLEIHLPGAFVYQEVIH